MAALRLGNTHTLELCSGPNCGKHTALAACAEQLCAASGGSVVLKYAQTLPESLKSGLLMPLKATDQFAVSEAAALSVVDLLSEFGIQAEIKWPNDILVDNKILSGDIKMRTQPNNLMKKIIAGFLAILLLIRFLLQIFERRILPDLCPGASTHCQILQCF